MGNGQKEQADKGSKASMEPSDESGVALSAQPHSTPNVAHRLQNTRVVLVRAQLARNIGSAARAMKTMGLTRLYLVQPREFPSPEADALAAGAKDVLDNAQICERLEDALADCHWVLGTSARRRGLIIPEANPRVAMQRLIEKQSQDPNFEAAILFGSERVGLENSELSHCHVRIEIPTHPDYGSLNLAQAVQILAYELRMAANSDPPAQIQEPDYSPASNAQLQGLYDQLAELMSKVDFYQQRNPEITHARLRRLFQRSIPELQEIQLLRGILSEVAKRLRD